MHMLKLIVEDTFQLALNYMHVQQSSLYYVFKSCGYVFVMQIRQDILESSICNKE